MNQTTYLPFKNIKEIKSEHQRSQKPMAAYQLSWEGIGHIGSLLAIVFPMLYLFYLTRGFAIVWLPIALVVVPLGHFVERYWIIRKQNKYIPEYRRLKLFSRESIKPNHIRVQEITFYDQLSIEEIRADKETVEKEIARLRQPRYIGVIIAAALAISLKLPIFQQYFQAPVDTYTAIGHSIIILVIFFSSLFLFFRIRKDFWISSPKQIRNTLVSVHNNRLQQSKMLKEAITLEKKVIQLEKDIKKAKIYLGELPPKYH